METAASATTASRRGAGFWLSVCWLAVLMICALTASWLPFARIRFDPANGMRAPSWSHPFGTTRLGEDVLAICIHGTRVALIVCFGSIALAAAIGAPVGLAAGYFRGSVDRVVVTLLDAVMTIPVTVVALTVTLFVGKSLPAVVMIIGVLSVPGFARATRSATLTVADRDFVLAARAVGAGPSRVLFGEIWPNIAIPLGAYLLLLAGGAILAEGLLSFLGVGVPLDKASWGRLIQSGRDDLQGAWWWSMCPSGVFALTILALNTLQDRVPGQRARGATLRYSGNQSSRQPPAPRPTRVPWDGAALQLIDLCTYLPSQFGTVRAVDGVSLSIPAGAMTALVGESGAGKSMLARSVLGIEPPFACVGGQIRLGGVDLLSLSASDRRRHGGTGVAVVVQDPMTSLDPVTRIGWQVAEPARVHLGLGRSASRRHAVELLRSVGLPEPERAFRSYPHELSGGQRQRVAIALALSADPQVLIADEPTSSLDVIVQKQILDLLDHIRRQRGLAVLLITHDLPLAMSRADQVAVMYAGRIVEHGTPAQLSARRAMPYSEALFAAVPKLSTPSGTLPIPIPGPVPSSFPVEGCAFAPRCRHMTVRCCSDAPKLAASPIAGFPLHRWACWHPLGSPQVLLEPCTDWPTRCGFQAVQFPCAN